MGLDATVRCRCFEEGKLSPGPVPFDDLYIDEDGCLSSRKLDRARYAFDYRRFDARYGKLQYEFDTWARHCCEHEYGQYCDERVSNWAGCAQFENLVEEAGGGETFPLLSNLLPNGNGGIYPAEKAEATLKELDRFAKEITKINQWVLRDSETHTEIWHSMGSGIFTWMQGPFDKAGMKGGKAFFVHQGLSCVETAHFKQIPLGDSNNGSQRMKIQCLDTGEESETFDSLGPQGAPKVEREFYVKSEQAPFLFEGKYPTAERIRNLLVASAETGNPIQWC